MNKNEEENGKNGKINGFGQEEKKLRWPEDEDAIQSYMALLGFTPSQDKEGVFYKHIIQDGKRTNMVTWDFKQSPTGVFYPKYKNIDEEELIEKHAFREIQEGRALIETQSETLTKVTITKGEKAGDIIDVPIYPSTNGHTNGSSTQVTEYQPRKNLVYGRGTENHIQNIFNKLKLQSIILSAEKEPMGKDLSPYPGEKLGNGILYHYIPSIGPEISVEAIDMISIDMGYITTETLRLEKGCIEDKNGKLIPTYVAEVKATDTLTGVSRTAVHEEIVDFRNLSGGRTFAMTNAQRKAERNAIKHLIPIPKQALIRLIQEMLMKYKIANKDLFEKQK